MSYSPQVHSKRTGLRPLHWVLLGVGGAILAFCGLCGIVGVIGSAGDDPSPNTSAAAATEPAESPSPSASPSETESTSPTPVASTAAPLVGDEAPASAEADPTIDAPADPAPTTRRAVPAAPSTRRIDPPKTQAPLPADPEPAGVYYKNCTEVRAAGAAPIHVGDPGYAKHLDRDGDGVGCE